MVAEGATEPTAGPAASTPWALGRWHGGGRWAVQVQAGLAGLVGGWVPEAGDAAGGGGGGDGVGGGGGGPWVLIDASALDPTVDVAVVADRLAACATAERPPARVVALVGAGWRGAAPDVAAAARAGAVVAAARWAGVALAPRRATVNVVAVPEGFPEAGPAGPAGAVVGVADVVHAVRFLLRPGNDYLTGQVISLTGGDVLWSNQSM